MPLARSFVSSACQAKADITLKSGQRMLFLLLLQGSYSQCTPFCFIWLTGQVAMCALQRKPGLWLRMLVIRQCMEDLLGPTHAHIRCENWAEEGTRPL